ncbi:sodium/potassium/calcium exchanger 3-like [Condylostylus longicornis]|uniref:sodium/potassium/calcium exchanger 3-like n=1 Tax=Condylostylus longicornis TaxID=2530218 RepID=UPI00244D9963|nr:sodium/potassium/calcium exchanger 3-like [Condylostylus longicornis]
MHQQVYWTSTNNLQKRKSSLALAIRITIFLGVIIFYCLFRPNIHKNNKENYSINSGRKLLGVSTFPASDKNNINCTNSTINEFPSDGLTREQRKNGWIILHILLACYCFWLLAVVCDDYFVPAIDLMCSSVKMDADVVGATFMAAAVSSPELFINCIGTFVTKTDLGTGTIVGSAVFNILAVPACCGLFTEQMENLDWWPISRDCLMYCFAILCLIFTLYDGKIMWYEALVLIITYIIYITAMILSNRHMVNKARKLAAKCKFRGSTLCIYKEVNEITPLLSNNLEDDIENIDEFNCSLESIDDDPWIFNNRNLIIFVLRWPITFLLWITIPNCKKHPKLKYITFLITVCWLAITSYLVSFFITYVGDTLNIPDSVMGLTILAAGMSIPEAVSSVLVTNQGCGAMGISNSIGSNTFGILIGLGLPWFVKSYFIPTVPNENWIIMNSSTLTYSAIALLATLLGFYMSFLANKFYLNWKVGICCTIMYVGFIILASMLELNFFSNVNLPVCEH